MKYYKRDFNDALDSVIETYGNFLKEDSIWQLDANEIPRDQQYKLMALMFKSESMEEEELDNYFFEDGNFSLFNKFLLDTMLDIGNKKDRAARDFFDLCALDALDNFIPAIQHFIDERCQYNFDTRHDDIVYQRADIELLCSFTNN